MRKISRPTQADRYVHVDMLGLRGEQFIGKDERRYAWRSARTVIFGSRLPDAARVDPVDLK